MAKDGRKKSTAGEAATVTTAVRHQRSGGTSKSAAASALTQVQNPRSGNFVKIDRATGTIVAHKRSRGAYPGVPIVGGGAKPK